MRTSSRKRCWNDSAYPELARPLTAKESPCFDCRLLLGFFAKTFGVSHPFVGVKICGVTCIEDALACADAGVEWIGLNFHLGSPRFIDPARAEAIMGVLPSSVLAAGVFVDRPATEVAEIANHLGLKIVQLHGQEPPEDLVTLAHLQVVRAFRLKSASDWTAVSEYLARARAIGRQPDAVLIDAYVPGQSGGSGATVPSDVLDSIPPCPG